MLFHLEGQLLIGRFGRQALPVALQAVDVPVAGRGQVEFPVAVGSLAGQEQLQAGGLPEQIAPLRLAGGSGEAQPGQIALELVGNLEGVGGDVELAGDREALWKAGATRLLVWTAAGKGDQPEGSAGHRSALTMARISASWASMLSVSRNCTRARSRLWPGLLVRK